MFYKFPPLENEEFRERLVRLGERAGTRVRGIPWKLSEKSKKANAALTGLGNTRRIILADTLLANYSPEEIEAVLAHELGHHVHRHIAKSILVQAGITSVRILGGRLGAALRGGAAAHVRDLDRLRQSSATDAGFHHHFAAGDAAAQCVFAFRRRQADRYAFQCIPTLQPFISSMEKLAEQNLAERPRRDGWNGCFIRIPRSRGAWPRPETSNP